MCCCIILCAAMLLFEVGASYARKMERAKKNARRARSGLPPQLTIKERWEMYSRGRFNYYVARWVFPWRIYGWDSHKIPWILRRGTLGNDIIKSIKYFVHGCMFATLFFFLMTYHLDYAASTSFIVTIFLGLIFGLGMSFNATMRCVVHLTIPQLFSTKGRSLLLSYVFLLVMTHPLNNFKKNLEVMSQTMTCGQQMAVNTTKSLVKAAAGPIVDMLDDLREVLDAVKRFVKRLQDAFDAVKKMFQQIADAISAAKEWLNQNANMCEGEMGTPFHRCGAMFDLTKKKCKEKVWTIFKWICNPVSWLKALCHIFKLADFLCGITDAVKDMVGKKIAEPVRKAIKRFKHTFYFSVDIDYHYDVELTASQSSGEVLQKVKDGVQERLKPFALFMKWNNFWMTLMLFLVIYKSYKYRKLYLTRDGFDNFYMTPELEEIDGVRRALMKDRVFPMPKREFLLYANPDCPILTIHELRKLGKGIMFFLITAFQAGFFMAMDFLLYGILYLIQKHGHLEVDKTVPSHSMLHVKGSGILSDIYRAIISQFDPMKKPISFNIDTTKCLPVPVDPNWKIYKTIGLVLLFCFFSVLAQPYFARMRHVIVHKFYPKRQRQRSLWLYNNILMRRGTIMFFVRRQVRRMHKEKESDDANDLLAVLGARCGIIGKLLRLAGVKYKYCIACGTSGKAEDEERFRQCLQMDCNAVYCLRCFVELGNVCTACMSPCDYGDMDEMSDEKDSSDEDGPKPTISAMKLLRMDDEKGSLGTTTDDGVCSYGDNYSVFSDLSLRQRELLQPTGISLLQVQQHQQPQQQPLQPQQQQHSHTNINNNNNNINSHININQNCNQRNILITKSELCPAYPSTTATSLPSRPIIELVTIDIFDMAEDLKKKLKSKQKAAKDSNEDVAETSGLLDNYYYSTDEEEEEDELSDPHEISINRS